MNVLVIPEDFRKDQYLLKPVVEAMLTWVGKPRARVRVCCDPLLGGVHQALNWPQILEILLRYKGMVDLFLLVVDRDGEPQRRSALDRLESLAQGELKGSAVFLSENAWQELEVWALAAADLPSDWTWADVRSHRNSKEAYFEPYASQRGVADEPGGGRRFLGREAGGKYARVRALCREDVESLERRVASEVCR